MCRISTHAWNSAQERNNPWSIHPQCLWRWTEWWLIQYRKKQTIVEKASECKNLDKLHIFKALEVAKRLFHKFYFAYVSQTDNRQHYNTLSLGYSGVHCAQAVSRMRVGIWFVRKLYHKTNSYLWLPHKAFPFQTFFRFWIVPRIWISAPDSTSISLFGPIFGAEGLLSQQVCSYSELVPKVWVLRHTFAAREIVDPWETGIYLFSGTYINLALVDGFHEVTVVWKLISVLTEQRLCSWNTYQKGNQGAWHEVCNLRFSQTTQRCAISNAPPIVNEMAVEKRAFTNRNHNTPADVTKTVPWSSQRKLTQAKSQSALSEAPK